MNSVVVITVLG